MFSIPEQFSAATKANFDAQLALITALTGKAFESVEKFVDLNMTVAKTSIEESTAAAKQIFSAKDPQEFFSLTAAHAQPNAEKALAYGRHLATIASGAQAEFTKAAETQIAETNRKVLALVEEVSKNAPAGSENVVAIFKTAIGNANASYDHLTKTTKQAVEALEANLNTAVSQISQAAVKSTPRAAKK
ncbi:phasin family protein [Undibacterium terreum]|uniref:Phasin family protein n=1 Tax=Undibacterium terreum TaxID=1224302 RepID=A0A916UI83_9BURK|nr:phasin family protein [Undibacterium terreum]GGC73148.1 phasin family protein [Undibacterium terreum]